MTVQLEQYGRRTSRGGQAAGTTYGAGTLPNTLATAAAGNTTSSLNLTETGAGLGVAVNTATSSAEAAFSSATLIAPISTAVEPPSVPLMSQLSWGPVTSSLPARSTQWTVNLTNSIRNGGEGAPDDANESYTTAQALTAFAQAAAALPRPGNPAANGYVLSSTTTGVLSWIAMSGGGSAFDPTQPTAAGAWTFSSVTASGTVQAAGFVGGSLEPASDTSGGTGIFLGPGFLRFHAGQSASTMVLGSGLLDLGPTMLRFGPGDPGAVPQDTNIYRTGVGALAIGNNTSGNTSGSLALGGLVASGTISGNRVCRKVSASATAVISQSGTTPPDEVFLVDSSAGPVTITVPPTGLVAGQARRFAIFDAGGAGGTNSIVLNFFDCVSEPGITTDGGGYECTLTCLPGGSCKLSSIPATLSA